MNVCLTIDVEHDCPPFRATYRGVTEGLPKFLGLLESFEISATFFTTGDVAERFPEVLKHIVELGHEIGCHGHTHARLDKIKPREVHEELSTATGILRKFYPVTSFRAPNLKLPRPYLKILKELGYTLDSTQARHKNPFLRSGESHGLTRLPVSTTSLVIRAPRRLRNFFLKRLKNPIVLLTHPWEFVDLRRETLRWDCRYNTGPRACSSFEETIRFFRERGARFLKIKECIHGRG